MGGHVMPSSDPLEERTGEGFGILWLAYGLGGEGCGFWSPGAGVQSQLC